MRGAGWVGLLLATTLLAGQAAAESYKPPRLADGRPDLQGDWTNASLTRLERNSAHGDTLVMTEARAAEIEAKNRDLIDLGNAPTRAGATVKDLPADCSDGRGTNCNYNAGWTDPGTAVMRVGGQPRNGFITSTADGRVPMRPGVRAASEGRPILPPGLAINDNPETRSPGERCLVGFGGSSGPVMQPVLYNNLYQIVQTPGAVAIVVEMVHDARIVRIGGQHPPADVRVWMGDSIGRWEGDTLVVETTNYHPQQVFRGASVNLRVTERFTRVGPDRLRYAFWVEDPTVFREAWGGEYEFARSPTPMYEYACHEGNYGLAGILAGAREEERAGRAPDKAAEVTEEEP
jgi:hypothetical protein